MMEADAAALVQGPHLPSLRGYVWAMVAEDLELVWGLEQLRRVLGRRRCRGARRATGVAAAGAGRQPCSASRKRDRCGRRPAGGSG